MTFVKGKSGNPAGKPPGQINRAARMARLHDEKAIKVLVDGLTDPKVEIRVNCADKLLCRGYGAPKEFVEIDMEALIEQSGTVGLSDTDRALLNFLAGRKKAALEKSGPD